MGKPRTENAVDSVAMEPRKLINVIVWEGETLTWIPGRGHLRIPELSVWAAGLPQSEDKKESPEQVISPNP